MSGELLQKIILQTENGPVYRLYVNLIPGTYKTVIQTGNQVLHDMLIIK